MVPVRERGREAAFCQANRDKYSELMKHTSIYVRNMLLGVYVMAEHLASLKGIKDQR